MLLHPAVIIAAMTYLNMGLEILKSKVVVWWLIYKSVHGLILVGSLTFTSQLMDMDFIDSKMGYLNFLEPIRANQSADIGLVWNQSECITKVKWGLLERVFLMELRLTFKSQNSGNRHGWLSNKVAIWWIGIYLFGVLKVNRIQMSVWNSNGIYLFGMLSLIFTSHYYTSKHYCCWMMFGIVFNYYKKAQEDELNIWDVFSRSDDILCKENDTWAEALMEHRSRADEVLFLNMGHAMLIRTCKTKEDLGCVFGLQFLGNVLVCFVKVLFKWAIRIANVFFLKICYLLVLSVFWVLFHGVFILGIKCLCL